MKTTMLLMDVLGMMGVMDMMDVMDMMAVSFRPMSIQFTVKSIERSVVIIFSGFTVAVFHFIYLFFFPTLDIITICMIFFLSS